ncbi:MULTISPECIES: phBC6A51 family helix-turn-helix protein [unclassified Dysgonomonas]|uniref:phBC6A51 family helix-turn-helix protein n=1 Tax=unclassified Dysgonomonas TaxID=2630389 RepID=UPI0025BADFB9|nr:MULTISPECIES: phBC6A51 family helix-turn-helix protein [unclassified Dysgonomonas]HMM02597.1 phBC6A51 family helix-turn-helix protein [Dysgonomonas sp.]
MKYKEKIATEIIRMIEQDLCSISEICKSFKISRKTFYEWKKEKPEFKEAVEEAIDHREDVMIASARIGLKQLLEGYIQKKEKISYIPDKNDPANDVEKCRVVEKKFCPPSIRAIKYVLDREERKKDKDQLLASERHPLVIEVQDEETRRQLMILKGNGFRSGGSLNPEVVAAVDKELEEESKVKSEERKMKSEELKVKGEELKVKNEQGQVMEQPPAIQPSAAPVEKPKVNLYPFLPPGYTSRTD